MPALIVADICGVQPMTGPIGDIFRRSQLSKRKLHNNQYIRLRNRVLIVAGALFVVPILLALIP